MKKIVVIGSDPRLIGGAETFSRTLLDLSDYISFVSIYRDTANNIFDVENVYTVFERKFISRAINKLTKGFFSRKIIKKYIKRIDPEIAILNTPLHFDAVKCIDNVFLRQHTCAKYFWEMEVQFNKNHSLLLASKAKCKVVALSPQEKKLLVNMLGFKRENVFVIRNSCSLPKIEHSKKKNKRIIMLNRFDNDIKRMDLAIESMDLLPEFTLHIYGSGKDFEYINQMAISRNNVFIYPSTNDVKSALDSSAIFLNCSEFEGYPITCIEACRRGLPLIVRNTFSSADDIVDGNGVILDKEWDENKFSSAVRLIYDNYQIMSKRSIFLSTRFDPQLIISEWSSLLEISDK